MPNPWLALPEQVPYVLREDQPYVDAWNETWGAQNERIRLHTEVLPEPFSGPRDASLVVLSLNPGWSGMEPREHASALGRVIRGSIGDDEAQHVQPGLLDEFAGTEGGKWKRKCFRFVTERSGISYDALAIRVLWIEFHAYHSKGWKPLPVTLPSQWFGFDLVRQAVERGAVVVLLRGGRAWHVAVPSLMNYQRAFTTKTARNSSISPGNLPSGAFDEVINALGR
jgi:hypothetical protein